MDRRLIRLAPLPFLFLAAALALAAPPKPAPPGSPKAAPAKGADLDALIERLGSADEAARQEASDALARAGKTATDKLLEARRKKPALARAIDPLLESAWSVPPEDVAGVFDLLSRIDPEDPGTEEAAWKKLAALRGKAAAFLEHAKGAPGPKGQFAREALETARAVGRGEKLFQSAKCAGCHRIGKEGSSDDGPDLDGAGSTAEARAQSRFVVVGRKMSGADYLVESLVDPDSYVVPGHAAGAHPDPASLKDGDIRDLVAFLQALGGRPDLSAIRVPER